MSDTENKAWHFGNTSVRSPFRLRDGLVAITSSPIQGKIRGKEGDQLLRELLGKEGVVELGTDKSNSVGRKWRSALNKLGFLYDEVPALQNRLGQADTITPNGLRLLKADNVPAMQECFLRALAAYYIPSPQEKKPTFARFSPLRHTLQIMLGLEVKTGNSKLHFHEMSVIVQLTNSETKTDEIVNQILDLRGKREKAPNKSKFDRLMREELAAKHGYEEQTLNDYADTNFRYLKATGLVQSKGRGISLVPEKHLFIAKLAQDESVPSDDLAYYKGLSEGAALPTDDKDDALNVLEDLTAQLNARKIPYDLSGFLLDTAANISQARHALEKLISDDNETRYAKQQANEQEEIEGFIDLLLTRQKSKTLSNGEDIEIPKSEAPAYLEWVLWRAFLAMNHLLNAPYHSRKFKIDQDFLPVGCAPGGGPDMIFEFEDAIVVVEATLTASSRQEAAEGETVRRHVAQIAEKTDKKVYGLFIAVSIDSNTAHTFKSGDWYLQDDTKTQLSIVPIALADFKILFSSSTGKLEQLPKTLQHLLLECRAEANQDAPAWKSTISKRVKQTAEKISKF